MNRIILREVVLVAALVPALMASAKDAAAPATQPTAAKAAIPDTLDAAALPAYQKVDEQLAVGGQPSLDTLARLASLGFKTVISLRPEAEGPAEEHGLLDQQELHFVRVSLTADSFSSKDADAVAAILDDPERAPVLLHCGSSNRVGGLLAVLEARKGKSTEQAVAAGKKLGLKSPEMVEAVRKVIAAEHK